jgi:hypothetical protein
LINAPLGLESVAILMTQKLMGKEIQSYSGAKYFGHKVSGGLEDRGGADAESGGDGGRQPDLHGTGDGYARSLEELAEEL